MPFGQTNEVFQKHKYIKKMQYKEPKNVKHDDKIK